MESPNKPRQTTIRLAPEDWREFKIACVNRSVLMSEIVPQLVMAWTRQANAAVAGEAENETDVASALDLGHNKERQEMARRIRVILTSGRREIVEILKQSINAAYYLVRLHGQRRGGGQRAKDGTEGDA